MALKDLNDPAAVQAAIEECDRISEPAFLEKYGFAAARRYHLLANGRRYPSKAILAAAHGFQRPEDGPLASDDFYGGAQTEDKLRSLGFIIEVSEQEPENGAARRRQLEWFETNAGEVVGWPDADDLGFRLAARAKGIYKPKGSKLALSIRMTLDGPYLDAPDRHADGGWTVRYHEERRSRGHEPYTNAALSLCMEEGEPVGVLQQLRGKPDVQYLVLGLGRVSARAHGFFVIEGPVAADGESLSRISDGVSNADEDLQDASRAADSDDAMKWAEDARQKQLAEVVRRQGQGKFRKELLRAYGARCAMSGCDAVEALEAAHIAPYVGGHSNEVANGLLLRADLHMLFDLGLIDIDEISWRVTVSDPLRAGAYAEFHGGVLRLPRRVCDRPSASAMRLRRMILSKNY